MPAAVAIRARAGAREREGTGGEYRADLEGGRWRGAELEGGMHGEGLEPEAGDARTVDPMMHEGGPLTFVTLAPTLTAECRRLS